MDILREFNIIWEKFLVLCRAKLIEKSKQCKLSTSAAEMSVKAAVSVWFDPYDTYGQWLKALEEDEPDAAKKVKNILQSIKFEDIPVQKGIPDSGVLGVTAGGAAAGAGIGAWLFHFGSLGTALSAVIPAAVIYPLMKGYQKTEKEKAEKKEVAKYMEQMSLVREEIEGVLNLIS